ncbi:MAG: 4-hydroxy-tetrahydrodipicolinate reductase [Myxococcota bacterium]
MTRVGVLGAAGRMGLSIARVATEEGVKIVAAVDRNRPGDDFGEAAGIGRLDVPISSDLAVLQDVEVVVDFSLPDAADALFRECKVPIVTGTTGLSAEATQARDDAATRIPVVAAPNYSQGVTVLFHLAAEAARLLGEGFDAEVVEMHHRRKVDAPSGTAVRLAECVAEVRGLTPVHGRSGQVGARPASEIGVLALRGGDVVGEHTLFLAGLGERLELTHRATDRHLFARGALRAARWIGGRSPGLYDMSDVMGLR